MFNYADFFLFEAPQSPAEIALRNGLVPIRDKNGVPTRFYTTKAMPKWADGSVVAFAKSEGGRLVWIHPDQNDREDDSDKPNFTFKPKADQHPNGKELAVKPSLTPAELLARLDMSNIQQKMNAYPGPSEMGKKKLEKKGGVSELITKPWMPGFYFQNASSEYPIATDINGTFTRLDVPGREEYFQQAKDLAARIRETNEKQKKIRHAEKTKVMPRMDKVIEQLNKKADDVHGPAKAIANQFIAQVTELLTNPTYDQAAQMVKAFQITTNPSNQRITIGAMGEHADALTNRFSGQIMKAFQKALGHDYEELIAVSGGLDTSMMPSVLFQYTRRPTFHKEVDENGQVTSLTIDGRDTYQAIFTQDLKDEPKMIQKLTEQIILHEIYQRNFGQKPMEAKRNANRAVFAAKLYNGKLQTLASMEGETFVDLTRFRGETDRDRLVDGFGKGIDRAFKRMRKEVPAIAGPLKEQFARIAEVAHDDEAFEQGWFELLKLVGSDPDKTFVSSLKYICESLSAVRLAAHGKKILIATDATKGTVDVVGIRTDAVKDVSNLESVAGNIDNIIVSLDLTSVKKEGGSKASVPERLDYTVLDRTKVTPDELKTYSDTWVTELRDGKAPKERVKEISKSVFKLLGDRRYRSDIRKYFGLSKETTNEQLFDLISRGTAPPLSLDGVPHPSDYNPSIKALLTSGNPADRESALRLQMISALGFTSEFMLNRYTQMQLFNNEQYKKTGIHRSNGIDTWAFARYEFGETKRAKSGQVTYKGNIRTLLQSVPREDLETRWGNYATVERRVARAIQKHRKAYGDV